MTRTGYDTVATTVTDWHDRVPVHNPEVVLAYINGAFANTATARVAFPDALHLMYDVNGQRPDADILDVERGDATPGQAPAWHALWYEHPHNVSRPAFYEAASTIPGVEATLTAAGISRDKYLIHSAHYGIGKHICGPNTCGFRQADATQWSTNGVDISLMADACFTQPTPRPADPRHYDWYPEGPFMVDGQKLNERKVVEEYDRLRRHPFIHRPRLYVLRNDLGLLAGRVLTVAHEQPAPDGKPSWGQFHRGWRYQQLLLRERGGKAA